MPCIRYQHINFAPKTLALIGQVNTIIAEYGAQGYDMTLRQVYYQLVARDVIPNKQSEYKRLGSIITDARRAGLIDWHAIVDRTRNVRGNPHWESPREIVESSAAQFRYDLWARQPRRIEVWVEKDALVGVFARIATELDIQYFSCRGYTSDSELWAAARRLKAYGVGGQVPTVLHFGDHDPSGLDMTRDIEDRLRMFGARTAEVRRLALNMDQVLEYEPPPNPAKDTDCRFAKYQEEHGDNSWELDALQPDVLAGLVRDEVEGLRDKRLWDEDVAAQDRARRELTTIGKKYDAVVKALPDVEQLPDIKQNLGLARSQVQTLQEAEAAMKHRFITLADGVKALAVELENSPFTGAAAPSGTVERLRALLA